MSSSYTLQQIADHIGASLHQVPDSALTITAISTLKLAAAGEISFFDNTRYKQDLQGTQAEAVIVAPHQKALCPVPALVVEQPYLAFAKVAQLFATSQQFPRGIHATTLLGNNTDIHPSAYIGPHCVIHDDVVIGENCVIESHCVIGAGSRLGDDTHLFPRVTCAHHVSIGCRVTIASGAVIGSDGFGFAPSLQGWVKVPQTGGVVIQDNVDIGANTTIDRGAIEDTIIEKGVKLDNQIQIAHNVRIGENTIIAGCVGISGSTVIGKGCMIGGGSCLAGHINLADGVMVTGMSMVTRSINQAGTYSSGISTNENHQWRKNVARFHQLDTLARRVNQLEQQLAVLTEKEVEQ